MSTDRSARLTARNELFCAWIAAVCLAFTAVGFFGISGYVPPPAADSTSAEIGRFYADHAEQIRVGMVITFLSWSGWGVLVAAVSSQMARIEGRTVVLSLLQAISGCVGWVCLLFPTMFLCIATYRPERSPETTQTLHDLGWITAFMPLVPFALMAVAIAAATFQDHAEHPVYPRWFAYANLWAALLFAPGAFLIFFKTGPLAYDGVLVFWVPFVIFGAWILLLAWGVRRAALAGLRAHPQSSDIVSEQSVAMGV
jgi:hypothetical protein